jgi:hypothetical protein
MLYVALVSSEVIFWVLLLSGLAIRYGLCWRRVSRMVLGAILVNEATLLALAAWDLHRSGHASVDHVITAVVFGYVLIYGPHDLRAADAFVQRKLTGDAAPAAGGTKTVGETHARRERMGWYRHVAMWLVGVALMGFGVLVVGSFDAAGVLLEAAAIWATVLVIDGLISFSYTLWPRSAR